MGPFPAPWWRPRGTRWTTGASGAFVASSARWRWFASPSLRGSPSSPPGTVPRALLAMLWYSGCGPGAKAQLARGREAAPRFIQGTLPTGQGGIEVETGDFPSVRLKNAELHFGL